MTALKGQTVVLIGGSSGIGLETARLARAEGAEVVLTGRDPDRLRQAADEVGALSQAAFDATEPMELGAFFGALPMPIDHVMVNAGRPFYGPLSEMDIDEARRHAADHLGMVLDIAHQAPTAMRTTGSLLFMGGTGARRPAVGISVAAAVTAALPALAANLAVEVAPVRVNVIAAGFVDTPLSATLLGSALDERRDQLRATLPIGRVVGPQDIAALAVHLMANTAITGATFDIDGGQQLT